MSHELWVLIILAMTLYSGFGGRDVEVHSIEFNSRDLCEIARKDFNREIEGRGSKHVALEAKCYRKR